MKKYLVTFMLFCSCLFSNLFGETVNSNVLQSGIYQVFGRNPGSNEVDYRGKVFIDNDGSKCVLLWIIDDSQVQKGGVNSQFQEGIINSQIQKGLGILQDHVLSVTYYDSRSESFGVASYVVTGNGQLEGKWGQPYGSLAQYGRTNFGQELLIFESDFVP